MNRPEGIPADRQHLWSRLEHLVRTLVPCDLAPRENAPRPPIVTGPTTLDA